MRKKSLSCPIVFAAMIVASGVFSFGLHGVGAVEHRHVEPKTLNVLFIGNSYTVRHNLSQLVKEMAEVGDPSLRMEVSVVSYGGRTLADHWRLGTQNFVRIAEVTPVEVRATIKSLRETLAKKPNDRHAALAIKRQQELLEKLDSSRKPWDVVVLQSYRDDLDGDQSLYVQYAPKFAALIKAQGGRVVLYETTPTTQNAHPLTAPPDSTPVKKKARTIAALAHSIDATVVPMSMVALQCQKERPDLVLRFISDAHLNQTLAYLTACTFYAALFERSPEGLSTDTVTDTRFLDRENRDKDRDGGPLVRKFSSRDRVELQRIAWEGLRKFHELARSVKH